MQSEKAEEEERGGKQAPGHLRTARLLVSLYVLTFNPLNNCLC